MHVRARTRIVVIAAVAYSGLLVAGTLQWLDGRALIHLGWLDGTLWLVSTATLTAVAVTALRAPRSPVPARLTASQVPMSPKSLCSSPQAAPPS